MEKIFHEEPRNSDVEEYNHQHRKSFPYSYDTTGVKLGVKQKKLHHV